MLARRRMRLCALFPARRSLRSLDLARSHKPVPMPALAGVDRGVQRQRREIVLAVEIPNVLRIIGTVVRKDVLIFHRRTPVVMEYNAEANGSVLRAMRTLEGQSHDGAALF